MKRKPILGETLYSLNVGNAARHCEQVLTPVVVKSIGRKYFTVESPSSREVRFYLENWRQATNYCPNHELFESEQAWLDDKKTTEILAAIKDFFGIWGRRNLTLDQLTRIKSIIDEPS